MNSGNQVVDVLGSMADMVYQYGRDVANIEEARRSERAKLSEARAQRQAESESEQRRLQYAASQAQEDRASTLAKLLEPMMRANIERANEANKISTTALEESIFGKDGPIIGNLPKGDYTPGGSVNPQETAKKQENKTKSASAGTGMLRYKEFVPLEERTAKTPESGFVDAEVRIAPKGSVAAKAAPAVKAVPAAKGQIDGQEPREPWQVDKTVFEKD